MSASQPLVRLSDADYEVAPGEPDVRGWDVVLGDEEHVGEVDDLLINPSVGKVRYLEVEIDAKTFGLERDRHVLIPIEGVRLDTTDEEVVLSGMSHDALLNLPEYHDDDEPASGYDSNFRSQLNDRDATRRMTRSAEELRIGKRTEKQGEVRVSKHVETEHVKQTVPLQGEDVIVERRPVERGESGAAEMRGEEIAVPVMEEEAVVEKRPVVKEEVVIRKEPRTTQQTVETDVRREEIDVEPSSRDVRVKDEDKGRGR
jgi:uncharacterized protein (TIGR02271 family)